MDPLVPALVAALLAGLGDRPAALAALLVQRGGRAGAILAGATLAQAGIATLAAVAAALLAPSLTPEARSLMLAVALIAAGAGALVRAKPLHAERRPRDTFVAALTGTALLGIADRTAFLAFAFALRGPGPALAATGAVLGAAVLAGAGVALAGEWRRVTARPVAIAAGALLLVTGIVVGAGALRVI